MTARNTSQSTRSSHTQVVKEAALIANFYGQRDQVQSLADCLVQSLALAPDDHHGYVNTTTQTYLRQVDPPAPSAHDTTIIQLALNTAEAAPAGWETMRKQLEVLFPNDELLQHIWGYTLIYQAELAQDVPPLEALVILLPVAQRLHSTQSQRPQPLAESHMLGGWLWLIDLPLQGDGLQAATVYLALSQPHSKNRLVQEVLYNPVAAFLMADLIAHKGYHQMRQYRLGDLDEQYRQKMEALSRHTDDLLQNLTRVSVTTGELDTLAREYGLLVSAVVHLDQLRVSLVRQEFNFSWWYQQAGESEVVAFHHRHLQEGVQELELLVAEGQHPLEATRTGVEMMRTRLDKQQEDQQQRIETLLTAVAVVFSVLVVIDKETARALLEFVGILQPIGLLPVLGVQMVFLVIASLLTVLVIKLIRARHPK